MGPRLPQAVVSLFCALVLLAASGALFAPAHAQSAGAGNRSARALRFDVDLVVESDGRLLVRETQEIAFSGGPFRKGTREIPMRRLERLSDVRVEIDGAPAAPGRDFPGTFSVSGPTDGRSDGDVRIEWWFDPASNTRRTFVLEYTARGAVALYDEGDQLRWNALTLDRPYPIERSTIVLRLPAAVGSIQRVDAYPTSLLAGAPSVSGTTATWRTGRLGENQPLEIRAQWPHGAISAAKPGWQEEADREAYRRESLRPVLSVAFGLAGLFVAVGGALAVLITWFSRGRDPAIGAVAPELSEPPSDLSPALAGTVVDERADVQDVVATLLDLAAREAISIGEIEDRKLAGSHRDFQLQLLDKSLARDRFEHLVLDSIFRNGDEVRLSRLGDWFGASVPRLQAELHSEAHRAGLFTADPAVVRRRYERIGSLLMGLAVVLGVVACSTFEEMTVLTEVVLWPFFALAAIGAVVRWTARAMPRRTAHGALEAARWRAYARHLARTAPEDQDDDTIDKTLPYAVALGADREWVSRLATVGRPAPRWMRRPPVVIVGGPMGGPFGGPLGGPWGGPAGPYRRGDGAPTAPGQTGSGELETPTVGGNPLDRGSNSLFDLIQAASDVLGRGGSGGWSGGGFGGGAFGGGAGGGGGGGSSFE